MDSDRPTVRPEELLAQLGWVKALARSVVFDPEMADDLLQRVCLLALQQAPRGAQQGVGLRAWLAAVTRGLARRSARSERRRARREQLAAQAEALPSTAEVAERRETLRLLVEAVTGLEEPYFSSIVERYFEGLSVAEIAARHGLATATVRQRLWRARQQLRARLEPVVAADHSGWLAATLPAATLVRRLGGLVVAKPMLTSGTAKLLVALGLAAALSFTAWSVLERDDGPEVAPATLPAAKTRQASDAQDLVAALPPVRTGATSAAGKPEPEAFVAPAPVATAAAAPVLDDVAALLDSATASFTTENPDLLALNRAVLALAQSATVVPDSVALDPLDGSVHGSLAIAGSELKGAFTISATGRYDVRFDSQSPGSVQPPFFSRNLGLSFKDEAALATDVGTHVQFNPDTSAANFASVLSSLQGDAESCIGWSLAMGRDGTTGQPMAMKREDGAGGPSLHIGRADTLPKLDYNWASDTSAYDLWLSKLREHAH